MDTVTQLQSLSQTASFNPLDPTFWLETFGAIGVLAIMFAETGLLIGFFLPGDSLLFMAGVATTDVLEAAIGARLSLWTLLIGAPICAIAGAQLGHFLGARYGSKMFDRPDSKIFKREYVEKAEYYFQKFGPAKAVVLARFIPIVRTFLNPVAGMLEMPARTFFLWNVIGGILWTDGIILAGHFLADSIPAAAIDKYLLPVVALIVLISMTPIFIEVFRGLKARKLLKAEEAAARDAALAAAARPPVHDHWSQPR
ncbi:VTT domain-containing protein [Phytomonospora sp. NPDC050363]|uniref:DedA family protein n=1 Tax=Phytomonospora sp. NPDC050363 TaxID=3155642 RepID=UPI0033C016E9